MQPTGEPDAASGLSTRLVTVLIVGYNDEADVRACLDSLREEGAPLTCVVVDNSDSGPGLQSLRAEFPETVFLRPERNLGFAGGNNFGFRHILRERPTPYVFLLNPDARPEPGALTRLLEVARARPEAAVVAPTILLPGDLPRVWYERCKVSRWTLQPRLERFLAPWRESAGPVVAPTEFVSGCAMLISSRALREVGGFDERFFLYEEDLDLSLRLRRAGRQLLHVADAVVVHDVHGSSRTKGEEFIPRLDPGNPRLPFHVFHLVRNRILCALTNRAGAGRARFACGFAALLGKYAFRYARRGRWDGIRAMLKGLRAAWESRDAERGYDLVSPARSEENAVAARGGGESGTRIDVCVIEPVSSHGGMDYIDAAWVAGLRAAGVGAVLSTSATPLHLDPAETSWEHFRGVFDRRTIVGKVLGWTRASLRTLSAARARGIRIVHLHWFGIGALELLMALLCRTNGFLVVASLHDVESLARRRSFPWIRRLALRFVQMFVVHNRHCLRLLEGGACIPRTAMKIVVPLPNYVPFVPRAVDRGDVRKRLDLPEDAPVLLFFGQLKRAKGLDVLLRALPAIRSETPDVVLLVVGRPWRDSWERYADEIDRLGIAANVRARLEYVPNEEVWELFAAADVIVLPYREIYQSAVLLMAMSFGLPVLASDLPAMREMVIDGESGRLFPVGDAGALARIVLEMLRDPQTLARLGERGREEVERSGDWGVVGRKLAEAYTGLRQGRID